MGLKEGHLPAMSLVTPTSAGMLCLMVSGIKLHQLTNEMEVSEKCCIASPLLH